MKKVFIVSLINLIFIINATAQSNQPWNGKKCAVVLTYDDAINEHLDNAIPVLKSFCMGIVNVFICDNDRIILIDNFF